MSKEKIKISSKHNLGQELRCEILKWMEDTIQIFNEEAPCSEQLHFTKKYISNNTSQALESLLESLAGLDMYDVMDTLETAVTQRVLVEIQKVNKYDDAEHIAAYDAAAWKLANMYIKKVKEGKQYTFTEQGMAKIINRYDLTCPGAWDKIVEEVSMGDLATISDYAFEDYLAGFEDIEEYRDKK